MSTRNQTIASFFTVAMGAMLVGAVVGNQVPRSSSLEARAAEGALAPEAQQRGASVGVGLDTFKDIARRANPGVVNINTSQVVKRSQRGDPFRDFFGDDLMDRFFGPQGEGGGNGGARPQRQTQTSLGSGFIIDKAGYILTNRHVVEGADKINVSLYDDRNGNKRYEAKLVGKDARTDVALLKIEPKETLVPIDLGDSDQVDVGEWVMAIGNPFGLGGNSVTVGVVSYRGRGMQLGVQGTTVDMIQTDAAINPGNSGGPLLNTRGQVVGINTMIITGGERQSAGVGFSVPINAAKEILPQLRDKGKVARGWLGISITGVSEDMAKTFKMKEARGALVAQVTAGSPAEKAGLQVEDVVITADGHQVQDNGDLSRYIASKAPGVTVKLEFLRDGAQKIGIRDARDLPRRPHGGPEAGRAGEQARHDPARLEPGRGGAARSAPQHQGRRGHGRRGRGARRGGRPAARRRDRGRERLRGRRCLIVPEAHRRGPGRRGGPAPHPQFGWL